MAKTKVFLVSMYLITSLSYISCILPQFLNIPLGGGTIRGVLTCDLNGNPNAPPISGAVVTLACANATTNVAQAVTDPAGAFYIILKGTDMLLYDPSDDCFIEANIPSGSCQLTGPDGVLRASVNLVNVFISGSYAFANYTTDPFFADTL